jgi:hypothetical protein
MTIRMRAVRTRFRRYLHPLLTPTQPAADPGARRSCEDSVYKPWSPARDLVGAMRDYYTVLQVVPEADAEVVVAAYRTLARKHHPDQTTGSDTDARMRDLNEAFEVLSDPLKRHEYDAARSPRAGAPPTPLRPMSGPQPATEHVREPQPEPVREPTARRGWRRPVVLSMVWVACFTGAIVATASAWKAEFDSPPPLPSPRVAITATPAPPAQLGLPYRTGSPAAVNTTPSPVRD